MTDIELMELLGWVFTEGGAGKLAGILSDDCVYDSDYAGKSIKTADAIIDRMNFVDSQLPDNGRYTCKRIELNDYLIEDPIDDWSMPENERINPYGLLLYQFDPVFPAAVVTAKLNSEGKVTRIWLCRDANVFNVEFCRIEIDDDAPRDLPSTVTPLSKHDRQVRAMRTALFGRHPDLRSKEITDGLYIWRKADEFIEGWLHDNGYSVDESKVFPDCIGYRCARKGLPYTVFMYAYGTQKTTGLDGEYCSHLLDLDFSTGSTVLVVYLETRKETEDGKTEYKVTGYLGKSYPVQLWRVSMVDERYILEYYPRQEMVDATYKLMYAFNRNDLDAYDCIVQSINPSFDGLDRPGGCFYNDAFYFRLRSLHEKYGDMKLGYVRFNDVIYSVAPYLDGYGFFDMSFGNDNRIGRITSYPFEGRKNNVKEFIKAEEREDENLFSGFPDLLSVKTLPPVNTERFALKITFTNGKTRKYILPMKPDESADEVVSWHGYVFTDKIWESAAVRDHLDAEKKGYPRRRPAVVFKNDFFISGFRCWQDSMPY